MEFLEDMKIVYPDENNVVLNENSVERKPCINRESKSDDITIKLYSYHDINMMFLVDVATPSIYQSAFTFGIIINRFHNISIWMDPFYHINWIISTFSAIRLGWGWWYKSSMDMYFSSMPAYFLRTGGCDRLPCSSSYV